MTSADDPAQAVGTEGRAALDPDAKDRTGQLLDQKYRIVRLLGEGGMGAVYEAEHTRIGRRCAVKFLHADVARNEEIVRRFLREAQAASSIGHPGIIDIYDVGTAPDGAPFLVMELLEGRSLAALLDAQHGLPVPQAVEIVVQALGALAVAHARGIVHRDLKPDNLFLRQVPGAPPSAKILDFGISHVETGGGPDSRLTRTGSVLGTPTYMAPEQAGGLKDVDQRLDLYAIGVILYECLTGRVPFQADNYNRLIVMILGEPFPAPRTLNPAIPAELEAVVLKAMARRREDRYGSADELIRALAPFLSRQGRARLDLPEPEAGPAEPAPPAPTPRSTPAPGEPPDASRGETVRDERSANLAAPRAATTPTTPAVERSASTTSATPRRSKALPIAIVAAVVVVAALVVTLVLVQSGSDGSAPAPLGSERALDVLPPVAGDRVGAVTDDGVVDGGGAAPGDVVADSSAVPPPDATDDAGPSCRQASAAPGTWCDPTTGLVWQNPPEGTSRTWTDAVAYCEALALGGHDDWRPPTITELRSLIRGWPNTMTGGMCPVEEGYTGRITNHCTGAPVEAGPAPQGCYWPEELTGDCWVGDWSSSPYADHENELWMVNFMSAYVQMAVCRNRLHTRCVRGDRLPPPPPCDADQHREAGACVTDPPWTDPATGLDWERLPHGQTPTWSDAVAYCDGLALGGDDDWRLPTIEELLSLVRGCPKTMPGGACTATAGQTRKPAEDCQCDLMQGCYLPAELWELQGECGGFWSSSPFAGNATDAWWVNFGYGRPDLCDKELSYSVRCVRGGP